MKSLLQKRLRFRSKLYIRILQVMGICGAGFLSACVKYGTPEPEYGVLSDEIRFHGAIRSEDSLISIPGLHVSLFNQSDLWDSAMTTTSSQGDYLINHYTFEGQQFKLKVHDADANLNAGDFKDKIIDIIISSRDVNNSEHPADILMEKK